VILLLVVVAAVLMRQRSVRRKVEHAWQLEGAAAVDRARSARDVLVRDSGDVDPARRTAVGQHVESAADALDRLAASAPNDGDRSAAASTAEALRGLKFAAEADRLLREGATPPTGEQLQEADQSSRDRIDDLDRALGRLEARLGAVPTKLGHDARL
jgi:hypothetical protein